MNKKFWLTLVLFSMALCLAWADDTDATDDTDTPKLSFSVTGGLAAPVGDGTDYWKMSYNGTITAMYNVGKYSSIGLRVSYNDFCVDEDKLIASAGVSNEFNWESDGGFNIIEIYPTIRLQDTDYPIFAQFGGGLAMVTRDATLTPAPDSPVEELKFDKNEDKFGCFFGAGFYLYDYVEISPSYNLVFTEGKNMTRYFQVNLGVHF